MKPNILQILRNEVKHLTAAQSSVADYILQHPAESAFMTIEQLAREAGASTTTIMRFAANVGYKGYVEFQKELQDYLRSQLPQVRLKINLRETDKNELFIKSAQATINNITGTVENVSGETLEQLIACAVSARTIYCIGYRKSFSVAHYLQQGLNRMTGKTTILAPGDDDLFEEIVKMTSDDLFVAVSFPRHSQAIIDITKQAKQRGVRVAAITDSYSSPLVPYSDMVLPCKCASLASHNSMMGAMFLADYLISATAYQIPDEIDNRLDQVEMLMKEMNYQHFGGSRF